MDIGMGEFIVGRRHGSIRRPILVQRVLLALALLPACSALAATDGPFKEDPLAVQRARAEWVQNKGKKIYYTQTFDLSGLPAYRPERRVSGTIRMRGSNYLVDSGLQQVWEEGFRKHHPDVTFDTDMKSTFVAMASLYMGQADIVHMGREASWEELMAYQRTMDAMPLGVAVATGSYNVGGWTFALGAFVHQDNPLAKLTLEQLDGIFGAPRAGGWDGTAWRPEFARGADKNIRTWGQLGLTGEWADKPIRVYGYNLNFHFPRFFADKVFDGGYMWNEDLLEHANAAKPDGGFILAGDILMGKLANDRYGIAYSGLAHYVEGTRALALANKGGHNHVDLTIENVQNRSYPLTREVYHYVNRRPGQSIDPKVKEFLRYILSREGQQAVQADGKFLPMTADFAREQRDKLD